LRQQEAILRVYTNPPRKPGQSQQHQVVIDRKLLEGGKEVFKPTAGLFLSFSFTFSISFHLKIIYSQLFLFCTTPYLILLYLTEN